MPLDISWIARDDREESFWKQTIDTGYSLSELLILACEREPRRVKGSCSPRPQPEGRAPNVVVDDQAQMEVAGGVISVQLAASAGQPERHWHVPALKFTSSSSANSGPLARPGFSFLELKT